jgi:hypothetical protein
MPLMPLTIEGKKKGRRVEEIEKGNETRIDKILSTIFSPWGWRHDQHA